MLGYMDNKLLVADLHLTDNPIDEYRWGVFAWLRSLCENVQSLHILGDLTDKKDNHSSKIVNRIIDELLTINTNVYILQGNHDAVDTKSPFFKFLDKFKNIKYINNNCVIGNVLFIPYTRNFEDIKNILTEFDGYKYIFMHQPFVGARVQNSFYLDKGIKTNIFKSLDKDIKVYSGDIHTPQILGGGRIEYIGAPYHITFGEISKGGAILLGKEKKYFKFDTINRYGITISNEIQFENYEFRKGDQVKIKIEAFREDFHKIDKMRKEIKSFFKDKEVELISIEVIPKKLDLNKGEKQIKKETDVDVLHRFGRQEKLSYEFIITAEELIC
jgi:DNA repair exonuclease SbcCD nuclease subunit